MKQRLRKLSEALPKYPAHRLNFENYGIENGIVWPVCQHTVSKPFYFTAIDGWKFVGWSNKAPLSSTEGRTCCYVMENEQGEVYWWHYDPEKFLVKTAK